MLSAEHGSATEVFMKPRLHLVMAVLLQPGWLIEHEGKWREITKVTVPRRSNNIVNISVPGRVFFSDPGAN